MLNVRQSMLNEVKSLPNKKLLINLQEQVKASFFPSFFLLLIFILLGCQQKPSRENNLEDDYTNLGRENTQLTLNDAVLEQSNSEGNLSWKIQAKRTTYTDDRKIGYLNDITANLLQNREIILKVKGATGEVRENGNLILLKDRVVVSDTRNETVLRGNLIEWRPLENILIIKDNLQVNQPNSIVTADTATYFTDRESLELTGKVIVNYLEPDLLLESDRLTWEIDQQKIILNDSFKLVRSEEDMVTDRLLADKGIVDLTQNNVNLSDNIELTSLQPELKIATNSAIWNYQQRIITSEQPIQAISALPRRGAIATEQQLNVTGNQGEINLTAEIATMSQGVKGITQDNSTLYSQQAIWNIPQQEIVATGNVIYNQQQPKVDLTGDKAIIDLQSNKAIVTSDRPGNKPVVSVIEQKR